MENAAKAVIIAGGVLIAVALLTLFSYLVTSLGSSTANIYKELDSSEISEFNQQFLNFDGRGTGANPRDNNPLTVQDVATLINLAKDNNDTQKFPVTIAIKIDSSTDYSGTWYDWLESMKNEPKDTRYSCQVNVGTDTLLVDNIIINKIPPP